MFCSIFFKNKFYYLSNGQQFWFWWSMKRVFPGWYRKWRTQYFDREKERFLNPFKNHQAFKLKNNSVNAIETDKNGNS